MASSHEPASATPQLDTGKPTARPLVIYMITFHTHNWSHGVTLLDGRPPINEHQGIVGAYPTLSLAQDAALEWTFYQVQIHIRKDNPSGTQRDRDATYEEWAGAESIQKNAWWYMLSNGFQGMQVKAERFVFYDPSHPSESSDRERAKTVGEQGNRA